MRQTTRELAMKPFARDGVFAALLTGSVLLTTSELARSQGAQNLDGIGCAVVVVACGALGARRWRPVAILFVVTAALGVYLAREYVGGPVFVSAGVALFSVASVGERRRTLAVGAISSVIIVAVGATTDEGLRPVQLAYVGWAVVAVVLGDAMALRRRHGEEIDQRAGHLERNIEEEVRRRMAEERLKIARDLHDSVAHSMATINVQAGVAAYVIDRHPDQVGPALATIEKISAELLDELAAVLRVLRFDGSDPPSLSPLPGFGQIAELVAATRQAGLDVDLVFPDAPAAPVARRVETAAYRIVQESLTNVLRHAGTAKAWVTIDCTRGLLVEVVDNGDRSGHATSRTGVGIIGMRERAEASGGSLEAGPVPGRGFRVRATWKERQ